MIAKFTENWILKIVSLAFAMVLWFFVVGERKVEIGYAVPLEYQKLPEGLVIANQVPRVVDIRISGPRALLMNFSVSDISLAVDLTALDPGLTTFRRLDESLNIPSGLKVTRVSPSFVEVKLDRVGDKLVPVKARLEGVPAEGFQLVSTNVVPLKIPVSGAESELKDINELVTEKIELEGVKDSFSQTVAIDFSGKYTDLKEQKTVEVEVMIEPLPDLPGKKEEKP